MIRRILEAPDPRLSEICAEIGSEANALPGGLIEDMFETMYEAPGRGLAAPQIGVMLRVFVMDPGWVDGNMTPFVMINPVIEWASDALAVHEEGCLSIPDTPRRVARPAQVRIRWHDLAGAAQIAAFEGMQAVCAQHEMDHLDGKLITDHPDAGEVDA